MKKLIRFFLFLSSLLLTLFASSQNSTISIKPDKSFGFTQLYLCTFNPVYGISERLNVNPSKKNGYYVFRFSQSIPRFYRIENEARLGIGIDIYIEPGENLKLNVVSGNNGVVNVISNDKNSGNNTLLRLLEDSIRSVYIKVRNTHTSFTNPMFISDYVDSIFKGSILMPLSILRQDVHVSDKYEKNVLLPQLEILNKYFKNTMIKKMFPNNSTNSLFYNDSLMLHPSYFYWTNEFEYYSFRSYLFEKINNSECSNLRLFIKKIITQYQFKKDTFLYKIAISNGMKSFFECYRVDKANIDETIKITDSLIAELNLNKANLLLPDYMQSNKQAIASTEINLIKILSFPTKQSLSLNEIFSDTNKIYLIDHWASWCGPCLKEMPSSIALQKKFKNDLRIIYLSKDTKIESCLVAIDKQNLPLENCFILDYSRTTENQYKIINPSPALPFYQFIYYSKGKYYLESADRPSDEKARLQIENILKQK